MGRPLRVIQNIYPYHLVCRTNNRTFRFNKRETTRIFFRALTQGAEKYKVLVHHVILLNNHYHVIATATEKNIHRFMQYLNSRVAYRYNRTVGRTGHLWGGRYGSCIIDTDEYYLACVRYIYRNPIRAGMVEDLEEFSDSSFQFWAFGKKMDVFLADDHLIMRWGKSKKRIREYFKILVLDEGASFTDEQVKKGLRRMFFGSKDFQQHMYETHCCPV
jgi:putative transposase